MNNFKLIVDILASLASIVAIATVLVSWFRNSRKPLKIKRVVVHRKQDSSNYILVVENRKSYPVEIQSIGCYTKKKIAVTKKDDLKPEYMEGLSSDDNVFLDRSSYEIGANGLDEIKIESAKSLDSINKLLFSISTSHGYHELWCKKILVVEMGRVQTYRIMYQHEYESAFIAKARYYWSLVKDVF